MLTPKLSQARVFTYPNGLPAVRENGFIANRDIALAKDATGTWREYIFTTRWEILDDQPLKGEKGDKGDKGDPGTSTSGGTGTPNIGVVRWVTNAQELNAAWAGVATGQVRSIHLAADITLTQTLVIPANYNRILEIDGHGCMLTVPSSLANGIFREYADLQSANAGIDCQLRIKNVIFMGSNRQSNAITIHANYGAKIEGCRLYNFKTAYYGGWTMGTIIEQCYFWENYIGIDFDYARFSGGSNSASQSNHSIVRDCKFRNSAGDFACIKATAVSGLQILHNIFEGVENGGDYDVYFDDNSSNVVKEFLSYGNHHEHKARIAAYYVRLKDGYAQIGGVYSQYDQTLISFESSAYAKMIVSEIPYLTSGTKFENKNSAGRWEFINPPATFVNTDATRWVGAIPSFLTVNGWDTNGQRKYIQGTLIK